MLEARISGPLRFTLDTPSRTFPGYRVAKSFRWGTACLSVIRDSDSRRGQLCSIIPNRASHCALLQVGLLADGLFSGPRVPKVLQGGLVETRMLTSDVPHFSVILAHDPMSHDQPRRRRRLELDTSPEP